MTDQGQQTQATGADAAVRDAEAILDRTASDEREAEQARARYREAGLPAVTPDPQIAAALLADEAVVEVRQAATIGRHLADDAVETLVGRLYLTTRRLVLLGQRAFHVPLDDIDELALAGERLLVTLNDGTGLAIDAGGPRLLRVQVAAARAAAR
jgi:hypothetical protein